MIHFCVKFKKENASIAADSRMASGTFGCPKVELVAGSANQRNSQILFWFQSLSEFQSLSLSKRSKVSNQNLLFMLSGAHLLAR